MIDSKQAVEFAKHHAAHILGESQPSLEEIERDTYKDREVWSITLGFPRDLEKLPPFSRLAADPLDRKSTRLNSSH